MANQLRDSNSPYLLQHADNPVDWHPWGARALALAEQENKPIFLSIGYAACHWCHVMAHESFEDPETAAYLNQHFINIKVDREEKPEIDAIYMKAVVAMTGQGGWPMSVFLTPAGKPFYGGTYFPPQPRLQLPSFRQVLATVVRLWQEEPEQLHESGDQITAHLNKHPTPTSPATQKEITISGLEAAVHRLSEQYDWDLGGWGAAPKFPQAMVIDFLLSQAAEGNQQALALAEHALESMAAGGMYDLLGGGFSRYSVDPYWLVPHFEKMLYDNALLSRAYLHAYLLSGNPRFKQVVEETLDFVARELLDEQGGFYASLDADSEGEEGKYYLWTAAEIEEILTDPAAREIFCDFYGVTEAGNFEGKTILRRHQTLPEAAQKFDLPVEQLQQVLIESREALLEARSERIRPATDDKVLASWNGLMLASFAEAGRYLNRNDYTQIAVRNAAFLLKALTQPDQRLLRAWRAGKANHLAYLEDYAALILGLIALYQTDPDRRWFSAARNLADQMIELFYDPEEGFYDTGTDHPELILRPREIQDQATPAGSSLAVTALLKLSAYTMDFDSQILAEDILDSHQDWFQQAPLGFGQWLQAANLAVRGLTEAALIGEFTDPAAREFLTILRSGYRPRLVVAVGSPPLSPQDPEILQDRPQRGGKVTAYLCRDFVCLEPVTKPEALQQQLEEN